MAHCPNKEGGSMEGIWGVGGRGWVTTAVLSLRVETDGTTNFCVIPRLVCGGGLTAGQFITARSRL